MREPVHFRMEVRVGCEDLGRRVTVRVRNSDGSFSDVLGVLETCDERTFGVRDRHGALRSVAREDVAAAKVVEAPGRTQR